ncbi:hypothetical protein BLNAU_6286 [Blattamonas nauphoetae]|uniref:Histone H2A/H2B/H3 domain-containing protein n=1 Tax=Blattamonas nauphoetae TaxID=2049346 RepID=A0ABQ9Y4W2_9EUKA|nr:hypothetical protein BLNAU_6286 [Blattamonas nauphoetae]
MYTKKKLWIHIPFISKRHNLRSHLRFLILNSSMSENTPSQVINTFLEQRTPVPEGQFPLYEMTPTPLLPQNHPITPIPAPQLPIRETPEITPIQNDHLSETISVEPYYAVFQTPSIDILTSQATPTNLPPQPAQPFQRPNRAFFNAVQLESPTYFSLPPSPPMETARTPEPPVPSPDKQASPQQTQIPTPILPDQISPPSVVTVETIRAAQHTQPRQQTPPLLTTPTQPISHISPLPPSSLSSYHSPSQLSPPNPSPQPSISSPPQPPPENPQIAQAQDQIPQRTIIPSPRAPQPSPERPMIQVRPIQTQLIIGPRGLTHQRPFNEPIKRREASGRKAGDVLRKTQIANRYNAFSGQHLQNKTKDILQEALGLFLQEMHTQIREDFKRRNSFSPTEIDRSDVMLFLVKTKLVTKATSIEPSELDILYNLECRKHLPRDYWSNQGTFFDEWEIQQASQSSSSQTSLRH